MRQLPTFLILFFALSINAQDEISLIKPIIESEPMSLFQSKMYASKTYRNWTVEALGLDSLLTATAGIGTKVCICDTGEPEHNMLKEAIAGSKNFTSNPTVSDKNGHSTHIAGIINEILPFADLYFAKVLSNGGGGGENGIANGIYWCINQKVDVINLSLGAPNPVPKIRKAIQEANRQKIHVVAAAGNEGSSVIENTIGYPARYTETITVGSIDDRFNVSSFSSSGTEGDLMAGGQNILSMDLDDNYILMSGTSMAAPFVTATIAFAKSQGVAYEDIRERLNGTAIDMITKGYDPLSFYGHYSTEFNQNIEKDTVVIEPEPIETEAPIEEERSINLKWWILAPIIGALVLFFELGVRKKQ